MIEAGRLKDRISIYSQDLQTLIATVWANVRPVTSREMMRNQMEIVSDMFTVLIRYRSGLNTAQKVLWQSHYYNIQAMTVDPADQSIILTLTLDPQASGVSYTTTE
jgi:SPP1 family predicted phage head-tail adaptor